MCKSMTQADPHNFHVAAPSAALSKTPGVSQCRCCQFYELQGRRGGHCDKLNVTVQGDWQACSLAMPAFQAIATSTNETAIHPAALPLEGDLTPLTHLTALID
jgi:hypothetical protein